MRRVPKTEIKETNAVCGFVIALAILAWLEAIMVLLRKPKGLNQPTNQSLRFLVKQT